MVADPELFRSSSEETTLLQDARSECLHPGPTRILGKFRTPNHASCEVGSAHGFLGKMPSHASGRDGGATA